MPAKNILLVEDDPKEARRIMDALEEEGYAVFSASSRAMAVDLAGKIAPSLVFVNAILTDASGLEVTRAIRAMEGLKDVPFIMLTEMQEEYNERYRDTYGIQGFLKKPVDRAELVSMTARVLPPDDMAGMEGVEESMPVSAGGEQPEEGLHDMGEAAYESFARDQAVIDDVVIDGSKPGGESDRGRIKIRVKVGDENTPPATGESETDVHDAVPAGKGEGTFVAEEQGEEEIEEMFFGPPAEKDVGTGVEDVPDSGGPMDVPEPPSHDAGADHPPSMEEDRTEPPPDGESTGNGAAVPGPEGEGAATAEEYVQEAAEAEELEEDVEEDDTPPRRRLPSLPALPRKYMVIGGGVLGGLITIIALAVVFLGGDSTGKKGQQRHETAVAGPRAGSTSAAGQDGAGTALRKEKKPAPVVIDPIDRPKPAAETGPVSGQPRSGREEPAARRERTRAVSKVAEPAAPRYSAQVGLFRNLSNAEKLKRRLAARGYDVFITTHDYRRGRMYRVLVGRYGSRRQAVVMVRRIRNVERMDATLYRF